MDQQEQFEYLTDEGYQSTEGVQWFGLDKATAELIGQTGDSKP